MATILVVDDSAVDRALTGHLVSDAGWSVNFAENGRIAMECIEKERPDAVLTDMQMPGLDGLKLVKEVRRKYSEIPVILMTAYGSEELAVKALKAGAANYVPKQNLKKHLLDALRQVFSIIRDRKERCSLDELFRGQESRFVLGYEKGNSTVIVSHFQDTLSRLGFGDEATFVQVGMALTEAINNAIEHGNLELDSKLKEDTTGAYAKIREQRVNEPPYCDRCVEISLQITPDQATFVVRDQGVGFDPSSLPDPTDPENLLKPGGRGILLIRTFMDEVHFNDSGNEITMVVKRKA